MYIYVKDTSPAAGPTKEAPPAASPTKEASPAASAPARRRITIVERKNLVHFFKSPEQTPTIEGLV